MIQSVIIPVPKKQVTISIYDNAIFKKLCQDFGDLRYEFSVDYYLVYSIKNILQPDMELFMVLDIYDKDMSVDARIKTILLEYLV